MKRFLSIVLIAAAVFGIYNYYVNIMDVFACKTYWEEKSSDAEDTLNALGAALNKLKRNKKTYTSGQKQLTKGETSLAASEGKYYQAGGQLSSIKRQISEGESAVSELTQMINAINKVRTEYKSWKKIYDPLAKERKPKVENTIAATLRSPAPEISSAKTVVGVVYGYAKYIESETDRGLYKTAVMNVYKDNKDETADGYKRYASDCKRISDEINKLYDKQSSAENSLSTLASFNTVEEFSEALNRSPELYDSAVVVVSMDMVNEDDPKAVVDAAMNGSEFDFDTFMYCATDSLVTKELKASTQNLKWLKYNLTDKMGKYAAEINKNVDKLAQSQDSIAKDVQKLSKAMLSDSTMKKYATKAMGSKAISVLEMYAKAPSPLSTNVSDFKKFEYQMDSNPGLDKSLEKAQKYLTTQKTSANKSLSSAKTKYKNALKSYNATPKKLETARKKLDNIKKKLAQFESSEKELEKGLNELANTEANGDLKSIKDRLGGKVKFTDKKGHIDINKGFDAVDAGEAYLNEQGDLIKKEITGRIIATVMGVISAVLALLAALLSLFRSNRGAAIIACISAVMAAGAAALGSGTSSVYSELAGSHVGNAPWMAAAIIAGVAMVFSVTHFAAKVEDPLTEEE